MLRPLLDRKVDDPRPEEFLQRREARLGHHMEQPAVGEEPVDDQRVEVRVQVEVFAESMDGHDDPVVPSRALGRAPLDSQGTNLAAFKYDKYRIRLQTASPRPGELAK